MDGECDFSKAYQIPDPLLDKYTFVSSNKASHIVYVFFLLASICLIFSAFSDF